MGSWRSWVNSETFIHIWETVQRHGRYRLHDWTVKLDPDAVFFPSKLRDSFRTHHVRTGSPTYVKNNNCIGYFAFRGPMEILSREGLDSYLRGSQHCQTVLNWRGQAEDYYMQRCLDTLGIPSVGLFNILNECTRPGCGCTSCWDASHVAYHPHKD